MSRLVSTALAVGGLTGGFATARATRNRPLGGAVLAAAGTGAFLVWRKDAGTVTAIALTVAYLAAFGGSHPLAKNMGPWTAVNTVSTGVGLASLIFGGRGK